MDNNNRGHSRCFPFLINIKVPAGDHHLLLGHKNDIGLLELWCSHGRRRGIEQSELYCVAVQHICQENQPLNGTYVDLYSHWMLVLHCLKFCVQSLVCSSGRGAFISLRGAFRPRTNGPACVQSVTRSSSVFNTSIPPVGCLLFELILVLFSEVGSTVDACSV